jgi:radical SAM enzyme (TIGR01210 family)
MANIADIPGILLLEECVWPAGLRATEHMLKSRIATFPEGQIVAIVGKALRGFISTEIVKYDVENPILTWREATDNGFITNTHNITGNMLYGINLSVWGRIGNIIADKLLLAMGKLIILFNLQGAVLGARIPRYHKFANVMSAEDYIRTNKKGRLIDPELQFYSKFGLRILKVLPKYIGDAESLDYGILLQWRNPLYREGKTSVRFSRVDTLYDYEERHQSRRWVLLLPAAGCEWHKKSGCYMCGFNKTIDEMYEVRAPTAFEIGGIYQIGKQLIEPHKPDMLIIYNAGSFLNDKEIPLSAQLDILEDVAAHPTIKKVTLETRPEFITNEKLSLLASRLQGKRLQLAIGLETASDFVRRYCINKGFTRAGFELAVKIAKSSSVKVMTYVFLKPLYLTEKEAISDAIDSVRYAFSLGSDCVAIEPAFVQEGTIMHDHFLKGSFQPPWLWSIVKVVSDCAHYGPIFIGGFEDEPPPIAVPTNCGHCDPAVIEAFDRYNQTLDIQVLRTLPSCTCKVQWEKELLKEYPPLKLRLFEGQSR